MSPPARQVTKFGPWPLFATILMVSSLLPIASPAAASATVLYVDGKHGSDSNSGLSLAAALKTIAKASTILPSGNGAAGWIIDVIGYTDYIYRERPVPPGWNRAGTSGAPIIYRAHGYNGTSSGYVRPIVSGADAAPLAGKTWLSGGSPGVWKTAWASAPFDFGKISGNLKTALFEDVTTWLWEQTSLSALASRAQSGKGGYFWSGGWLYVSAVSSSGPSGANPAGHKIDVITRNAFYFNGRNGVAHVEVRGFEVRHAANGISFALGSDYGVAADDVVTGNLYMGVATAGDQTSSGPNPSTGDVIQRTVGFRNTVQGIKLDQGTVSAAVCDNDMTGNGLQGIKVQGPPGGSNYTGLTTGVELCRNKLHAQTYNPTGSPYNNASGLTIANGARSVTVEDNLAWGNDVGVLLTQESAGRPAITPVTLRRNEMWSNRRFGLYLLDGYNGSGAGALTSSYDLLWDNGIGVMADRGTTNKTIDHDTIYWNRGEGVKVGGANTTPASVAIKSSLVTNNRSYGVWLVTGNTASVSYTGLYANTGANILGSPSTSHNNTKPPGYLSTSTTDPGFLVVSSISFQFTAGPGGTPIGARWADGFVDIANSPFKADIEWLRESGITGGCRVDYFCPRATVTRGQMAAFLARALKLPTATHDYFSDDNGNPFEADINRVAAAGISGGCAASAFCPADPVRRDQMASFLARALTLPASTTDFFTDDEGNVHEANINRVAAAAITGGCAANRYCPALFVTREQMAAFLHRAFG